MSNTVRKQQSFEYGAVILLCSTVLVKIIGAIFKIPLSNLIGDLGFGYFSSAYDLFTPIYTLAMAGLPIAVSRVVAEHMAAGRYGDVRQSLKITRKLFFITGFTALIIMLILIYPFVKLTDKSGGTIYSLFAIAPSLLFCCVMSTYRGYYEGLRNMYPTAVSDITEALGKLILGYGFAYIVIKTTHNEAFAAAAAMAGITVGAIVAALYLRLRYKFKGDGITEIEILENKPTVKEKDAIKALIMIAIPVVMASLANSIASLVDVSMVKLQLSHIMEKNYDLICDMYRNSIADYNASAIESGKKLLSASTMPTFLYGIRGKAFTIYNLVPAITSVLGVSALPVIASCWSVNDKKGIKRNVESSIKLTAIISMPAGMGFAFIGDAIMGLMYKSVASVEIGGSMMRIYGIAAIFAGLAIPMTSMLQAIDKQVISLRNVAIGAFLKIAVNFAFVSVPKINIQGAAIGTAVCYVFIFVANLLSIVKHTGVVPDFYKTLIKPLVAAICCGVSAFAFIKVLGNGKIFVAVSIAVAAVVYFAVLILLNTFEDDDVLTLPKGEKLLSICRKLKIIR